MNNKFPKALIPVIIIGIVFLIILFKATVTIGSGEGGVLYRTLDGGVVTDEPPMGEGFHFVAPWNSVFVYEVRQQSLEEKMQVLSSNGLEIKLDASTWFQPKYDDLGKLHKEKGEKYIERLLKPAVRSAARAVVGRYSPEQLYASKREAIQKEILEETQLLLKNQYVQVNEILVRDVSLPTTIKDAIRLTKAQKEAERQKIEAEGKARANTILSQSLTDKVLKEKGIQATVELSKSNNAKVIVVGSGDEGLPIILGNN